MSVKIGEKAPNFGVSEWVQGAPTNFDQEKDHIVLLEVFQVNCPGCFMSAIHVFYTHLTLPTISSASTHLVAVSDIEMTLSITYE